MGNGLELERAFAGATVHDMFNFLSVLILFPIEWATQMLARMTQAMTVNYNPSEGGKKSKGIKVIISPILDKIGEFASGTFFLVSFEAQNLIN